MPTLINIARAYILRGEAYSALQEHFTEGGFKDYTDGQKCMDRITAISAADVVEVVRCRECKHHDGIRCFRWNSVIVTGFDDYCSNGERKDGGQDDGT